MIHDLIYIVYGPRRAGWTGFCGEAVSAALTLEALAA
jgi:hypothetical protein